MLPQLEVVLLLALPASGKSEVRRYLGTLDPAVARRDMALGPTAQLDDYPYVHLMRRISQELRALEEEPIFFADDDTPLLDSRDWLTLIQLLNEDYRVLAGDRPDARSPAILLDRLDRARVKSRAPAPFGVMDPHLRSRLENAIDADVAAMDPIPVAPAGATVVIEFARGGPAGSQWPLPEPLGYAPSLAALDQRITERAAILYVWVDPAESRRRNRERAEPGPAGDASTLYHGVPETVMRHDYSTDDLAWLEQQARMPGTIPIGSVDLPIRRFDNRTDRTSFLRAEPSEWPPQAVAELHGDLSESLLELARLSQDAAD